MTLTSPLVVFGCSWPYGVGVEPDQNFGSVLSKMLNSSKFSNYSIPGSSNNRSVLQLLEYAKKNTNVIDHIAIFSITTAWRSALIRENGRVLDIIQHTRDSNPVVETWMNEFSSTRNVQFELHKNIITMQQICKHYQIKDFYIRAWEYQNLNLPGIDQSKIFPTTGAQLFGFTDNQDYLNNMFSENNQYLRMCGHPNSNGHKKIAETLYQWIKDKNV